MDDENEVRRIQAHEIGMALDAMSVDELEHRIGALEAEIGRLKAAIAAKSASRNEAEGFFKL